MRISSKKRLKTLSFRNGGFKSFCYANFSRSRSVRCETINYPLKILTGGFILKLVGIFFKVVNRIVVRDGHDELVFIEDIIRC